MTNESEAQPPVVRSEVNNGVATITLDRPNERNAINRQMRDELPGAMAAAEADPSVSVVVLTGADPAFCAGLDLKELGTDTEKLLRSAEPRQRSTRPFPSLTKPLIGAINGVAITGGFELALNCDFLIASEHAAFADTHARVGVMPGWGLTPLLADAVGVRRAREISLTGNFVSADEALQWGLVNRVVPHGQLMDHVYELAAAIVSNDPIGVARMLQTYAEQEHQRLNPAWDLESAAAIAFNKQVGTPGGDINNRRATIMERGRSQL